MASNFTFLKSGQIHQSIKQTCQFKFITLKPYLSYFAATVVELGNYVDFISTAFCAAKYKTAEFRKRTAVYILYILWMRSCGAIRVQYSCARRPLQVPSYLQQRAIFCVRTKPNKPSMTFISFNLFLQIFVPLYHMVGQ